MGKQSLYIVGEEPSRASLQLVTMLQFTRQCPAELQGLENMTGQRVTSSDLCPHSCVCARMMELNFKLLQTVFSTFAAFWPGESADTKQ